MQGFVIRRVFDKGQDTAVYNAENTIVYRTISLNDPQEDTPMKTLRLETTAPFQGLAELVASDEGLFEKEGIKIEWMDREKGVDKSPQMHITNHKDASRFLSHGKMMEAGQADLYNACEWGNYSRVEKSKVG